MFDLQGYEDSQDVLKIKQVKATRVMHACIWCSQSIPRKSSAIYRVTVYDGFMTDYWHIECWKAQEGLEDYSFIPGQQQRGEINHELIWPPTW